MKVLIKVYKLKLEVKIDILKILKILETRIIMIKVKLLIFLIKEKLIKEGKVMDIIL